MIISSYHNGKTGKNASLQVSVDENHFPEKYAVTDAEYKMHFFPGTKRGAADARRYYENIISIYKYE